MITTENQITSYPPTIGDSYGNGWRQLWKYFLELFLIGIIPAIMWVNMSFASIYHGVDRMKAPKI